MNQKTFNRSMNISTAAIALTWFIILIAAVLSQCNAQAVIIDTAKYKAVTPEQAIASMSHDFRAFNSQYMTGVMITAGGSALMMTSALMNEHVPENSTDHRTNEPKQILMIGGSLMSLIGLITIIDAHSHIGDAGRIHLSAGGLVLKLNR